VLKLSRSTFRISSGIYRQNLSLLLLYQVDPEASRQADTGIYDITRINAERLPAYHGLNLRADRRFHFNGSNLILYLSIWNAYNRQNVASYYWNEMRNQPDYTYQFSLLPILGVEFEF
jgi:hypothetical protein